ncbi:hypothetical protein ABN078_00365 [Providencia huaxiensis]|uniref:hypothetical protein n=1 Tax=Providencia huaxiensis TaxID=2027290 RepID=UPI0024AA7759|nr:hypothetical protein [Providencia stuartii]
MMKFVDKYVNEDKNNNPIIFKTKKKIIITSVIFFWAALAVSFVAVNWHELSVTLLLSAFPFAYITISYIKIEKPFSFWLLFIYQALPPIFTAIMAYIKYRGLIQ